MAVCCTERGKVFKNTIFLESEPSGLLLELP